MTKNEKENPLFDAGLQKQVQKIIAQECMLSRLYVNAALGVDAGSAGAITDMFTTYAGEAVNANALGLVKWCRAYGYETPCGDAEIKRLAGPKIVKYAEVKGGQAAGYYIDAAQKAEAEAAMELKKILDDGKVAQFTDLQSALWQALFAKQERVRSMGSAKIAFMANADMIIQ